MATASENARKVLNSIKSKLNLDKFPVEHLSKGLAMTSPTSDTTVVLKAVSPLGN